jgi:hypothetical protein
MGQLSKVIKSKFRKKPNRIFSKKKMGCKIRGRLITGKQLNNSPLIWEYNPGLILQQGILMTIFWRQGENPITKYCKWVREEDKTWLKGLATLIWKCLRSRTLCLKIERKRIWRTLGIER